MKLNRSFARKAMASALLAAAAMSSAQAANFDFAGQAVYNTDVVRISFSLTANSADFKTWTDSWQTGLNFDPVLQLWAKAGNDYSLIIEVDDNDKLGAGQGSLDAGIQLSSLSAGQYLLTLSAADNYAKGQTLSAGFTLDGSTPVAIADWTQSSIDPNFPNQKGGLWSVKLNSVDQAAVVPEPGSWALMGLGLLGLACLNQRRQRKA
ncbi:DVUA0089 family protein [Paucibacter sp. TC2R-5]|uniref:DVUA0089 family protein n=1 Tax=Paucibacter sp. TC2R-5 TaxID=2893555 RepID=UPI0021E403B3|nr:DVUA0089 family protein [Paucibacter sp. TC2R-5]MCV2357465.1 DVUA0089 family protein [Paucibacter sp. TC2R-5]